MTIANPLSFVQHASPFSWESVWSELTSTQKRIRVLALSIFAVVTLFLTGYYYHQRKNRQSSIQVKEGSAESQKSACCGLTSALKKGFATIPFLDERTTKSHFDALKTFYSRSEEYRSQFKIKDEIEYGYSVLPEKKCYVIRNSQVPEEFKLLTTYAEQAHQKAMRILSAIEKEMGVAQGTITGMVSEAPLPRAGKAPSVLRLFSYDPSTSDGLATDQHEDLGLLTIILKTEVPTLEVVDFSGANPEWVDIENRAKASEAIVLVGETLSTVTQGNYPAGTHRNLKSTQRRFSIVYQLRADPTAKIEWEGTMITIDEWMKKQKALRKSVNGSY